MSFGYNKMSVFKKKVCGQYEKLVLILKSNKKIIMPNLQMVTTQVKTYCKIGVARIKLFGIWVRTALYQKVLFLKIFVLILRKA
jgi:hypothetical protein